MLFVAHKFPNIVLFILRKILVYKIDFKIWDL